MKPGHKLGYLLLGVAITASATAAESGKSLFEAGNYQAAEKAFRYELDHGKGTDVTRYNLAVTLYRLHKYEASKSLFEKLATKPKWQALAWYNLGLIARAENRQDMAARLFRQAEHADNVKIRRLAHAQLEAARESSSRWSGIVTTHTGYDTNAARLANDLLAGANDGSDSYLDALGFAQYRANGTAKEGLYFYGIGYARHYSDLSSLDTRVVGGGSYITRPISGLDSKFGIRLLHTQLGGSPVANQLELSFGLSKQWAGNWFSVAFKPGHYYASDTYNQIGGDRQRIEVKWRRQLDKALLKTRYRWEHNDRNDLQDGTLFSSYSPTRNSVRAEIEWPVFRKFEIDLKLGWRHSLYDGVNNMRDTSGQVKSAQRVSHRTTLGTSISYRPISPLKLSLSYEHFNANDTFRIYDYNKSVYTASLEYTFD